MKTSRTAPHRAALPRLSLRLDRTAAGDHRLRLDALGVPYLAALAGILAALLHWYR